MHICIYVYAYIYIYTCIYMCMCFTYPPPPNSPRPPRFIFTTDVPAIITRTSNPTLCQQQSLHRADFAIATFFFKDLPKERAVGRD